MAEPGQFEPREIASALSTTVEELALTLGLDERALLPGTGVRSHTTQGRLRELVLVLEKVVPRVGSAIMAYRWFRSEPLAGFGGSTAMKLVQEGRAQQVLDYVDAVDAGIHA